MTNGRYGRNVPVRGERPDRMADSDTAELEEEMKTYEDVAKSSDPMPWNLAGIRQFFSWPVPNKIRELEPFASRPYRPDRIEFFRSRDDDINRFNRRAERTDSDYDTNSEDSEYDNLSQFSVSSDINRDNRENKWIECAFFCLRQLFFSRLWIFLFQYLGAHWLGAKNRFKTDPFDYMDRYTSSGKSIFGDLVVRKMFAGLRRWDAQHFLWITEHNYLFEQSLAFFPGFPEMMTTFSSNIRIFILEKFGEQVPRWVVSGALYIFVNHLFFHIAGILLYLVVMVITRSSKKSMLAVSLFAFNPASIFFSAAYSEASFTVVTLLSMFILLCSLRQMDWAWRILGSLGGAALMSISALVRSNGLLNVIFVAWYTLGSLLWEPAPKVREPTTLKRAINFSRNEKSRKEWRERLEQFEHKNSLYRKVFRLTSEEHSNFKMAISCSVMVFCTVFMYFQPIVVFGQNMVNNFCKGNSFNLPRLTALKKFMKIPEDWVTMEDAVSGKVDWCRAPPSPFSVLPPYYSVIQTKYWDVGFGHYWQLKKIPCFLMMLPAAIITVQAILYTLREVFIVKKWRNIYVLLGRSDHLVPFAIHASIMLFSALFFYNAEVFTRIIFSSSPFLYIYLADYLDGLTQGTTPENRLYYFDNSAGIFPIFVSRRIWNSGWKAKLLIIYFLSYFAFGTMAHAAWLPFT